jgi:hypothetical protein
MRAMLIRFGLLSASIALALAAAGCEKSNDQVVQDQLREGGSVCQRGCTTPPAGCVIKGNIGPGGKFFLLPGDPRYKLAIIDPAKGERWFCTETDARSNDFQPAPGP